MQENALRHRLNVLYQRHGGLDTESTNAFELFPPSIRDHIIKVGGMNPDEIPLKLYFLTETKWTVILLDRLVARGEAAVEVIPYSSIVEITFVIDQSWDPDGDDKLRRDFLRFKLQDGSNHDVALEAGGPLFGCWNVILALCRRPEIRQNLAIQ